MRSAAVCNIMAMSNIRRELRVGHSCVAVMCKITRRWGGKENDLWGSCADDMEIEEGRWHGERERGG